MSIDGPLVSEFTDLLDRCHSVLIGTHLNPDGDALGSALALALALDQRAISSLVLCHNEAPRNLRFLPGIESVRQTTDDRAVDGAFLVDLDALHRLGSVRHAFESVEPLVVIDHHIPHEAPGTLRIIDVHSPATALILYRLFQGAGMDITPEIATCLLTGIVTDTGSFRFRNTTPESLSAASQLLEHGADMHQIAEHVYQTRPLKAVRLLGKCLDHMRLSEDQKVAWSTLRHDDFTETGAQEEDAEGLANELLSIETVQIAMILREHKPQNIRCSMRSRSPWDVASIARKFGGGGHRNAAGCTFETTMEHAAEQLVIAAKQCLESS